MKNFASPARARALARLSLLCISAAGAHGTLAQNRLPEVVVTATRFAEPADNLPFGVSVITASEIQAAIFRAVGRRVP